jgi:hypothetical protein
MAGLTDAEKKTAVLVQLVQSGVVDLETLVDQVVKNMPADFDPSSPSLGSSGGSIFGPWFAVAGAILD